MLNVTDPVPCPPVFLKVPLTGQPFVPEHRPVMESFTRTNLALPVMPWPGVAVVTGVAVGAAVAWVLGAVEGAALGGAAAEGPGLLLPRSWPPTNASRNRTSRAAAPSAMMRIGARLAGCPYPASGSYVARAYGFCEGGCPYRPPPGVDGPKPPVGGGGTEYGSRPLPVGTGADDEYVGSEGGCR